MKKYDGKVLETIRDHKRISFEDFEKIYDKSTIDNQFTSMVRCGLIIFKDGFLEV